MECTKELKKPVNEEVQINSITPEECESYIQILQQRERKQKYLFRRSRGQEEEILNVENITQQEVYKAITELKNRKVPGPDNIPNEMLKYGGPKIEEELTILFQKMISTGEILKEWRRSIRTSIFKKRNKRNLQNYRTIILLNFTSKLFTKILTRKITSKIKISKGQ